MPVFRDYAKYYDVLYKDKDYKGEVLYIDRLIKEFNPRAESLLDIGCGTGRHAQEFARCGYEVTGIDSSENMINIARQRTEIDRSGINFPAFYHADVRTFNLNKKFDAVISLFHVISYQSTDTDLEQAFTSIKSHMKKNAVFIFDIWYGPAVLHLKPENRSNSYKADKYEITRTSIPAIDFNKNIVDVNYYLDISGPDGYQDKITETHRMRYFSESQMESLLIKNGFIMLFCYKWLTRIKPDKNSWSVCIIAKAS